MAYYMRQPLEAVCAGRATVCSLFVFVRHYIIKVGEMKDYQ